MSSDNSLDELLRFVEFTHLAHKVERVARIAGTERYANMVEHSYQLALISWYIIEKEKLNLDKGLVLKYALAHDLVEIYAGDTYVFDVEHTKTKKLREKNAKKQIKEKFPEFRELHPLIEAYESKVDFESKFVYAVDKIIDPLNIYLEGGKLYREKGVTLQMIIEAKKDKISGDPTITKYFEQLVKRLKVREKEIFGETIF